MRRRAGPWLAAALLLVGLVASGVPAGVVVGSDVSTGHGAGLVVSGQASAPPTWNETYTPESEQGTFRDAIRTTDGGYVLAGRFGPADASDPSALAIAVDERGDVEWVWSLQGYGTALLTSVVELDDGSYLVTGTKSTPDRGDRWFVTALTTDGEVAWRKTYVNGTLWDAVRVPGGGALLVGDDRATVITPNGAEIWTQRYREAGLMAASRVEDGYVLAGVDESREHRDRLLLRIDGTGEVEWRAVRETPGDDLYTDVVVDGDTIYAAGAAPLGDEPDVFPSVSAYHANGTQNWARTRRTDPPRIASAVALADTGVVAVVPARGGARLSRFAPTAAGRTAEIGASPDTLTALGNGRYLYAGNRGEDAAAGVVAPSFGEDEPLAAGTAGEGGSGEGSAGTDAGEGGSRDGDGLGVGVPSVSIGGVPPVVTLLLLVAAGAASLVAVAVTAIAIRRL